MDITEEQERRGRQACDLANEALRVVMKGETPGTQSIALALALGAVVGAHAPNPHALVAVLHEMGEQIASQASAHFNARLKKGEASLGLGLESIEAQGNA